MPVGPYCGSSHKSESESFQREAAPGWQIHWIQFFASDCDKYLRICSLAMGSLPAFIDCGNVSAGLIIKEDGTKFKKNNLFKQIVLTCLNKCGIYNARTCLNKIKTDGGNVMGKYSEDGKELLRLVGGRENIAAVSHCMTRMRFVLSDPSKADVEAIEAMKVVKGSFTQSGQFQVIIGNTVSDFYNDFVAVAGIEGVSKDAVKEAAKQNQTPLQRAIAALAEIFAPLIPAIITGVLVRR